MSAQPSPAPQLLRGARLRLAALSLLVMGTLLYAAGVAMGRLLLQTQETAIKRELQTLAGTLHDGLKPALPQQDKPSPALATVLPGLCLTGATCTAPRDLIHRHAVSASDPDRYTLWVFDRRGALIAKTPGASSVGPKPWPLGWSWSKGAAGERWASYAIHLHRGNRPGQPIWGYLRISSSLATLDADLQRLWWLGHGVFLLAMLGIAGASWWLAGLAMAPLVEAYRRQQQFSADVAHELRTPLANLLAVVEAEPSAGTDRMLRQGRRLQQLIGDLLLLASLERPYGQAVQQPCDLADITGDVMEELGELAAAEQVTLIKGPWNSPALVLGIDAELSRLVINLLSNAIHHSPSGAAVTVGLERRGRELRLSVQDHGPGIPEAQQQRIFDRFTRLDPARSRRQGGVGLGLAIAQAIALRHGGRITVQSSPGNGSCFGIVLPAAP